MLRAFWLFVLIGLPLATLFGGYNFLLLENHSVLMISLSIGGLLSTLILWPFAFGALFPKLAKKANTPLDQLGKQYPATPLRQAAPRAVASPQPAPQPASLPAPVEKIIERQVVVIRCEYCKELTPADLSACKNCGARSL